MHLSFTIPFNASFPLVRDAAGTAWQVHQVGDASCPPKLSSELSPEMSPPAAHRAVAPAAVSSAASPETVSPLGQWCELSFQLYSKLATELSSQLS